MMSLLLLATTALASEDNPYLEKLSGKQGNFNTSYSFVVDGKTTSGTQQEGLCQLKIDDEKQVISIASDNSAAASKANLFGFQTAKRAMSGTSISYSLDESAAALAKLDELCTDVGGGKPTAIHKTLFTSKYTVTIQAFIDCGPKFVARSFSCKFPVN